MGLLNEYDVIISLDKMTSQKLFCKRTFYFLAFSTNILTKLKFVIFSSKQILVLSAIKIFNVLSLVLISDTHPPL